jgi:NAD(P)H-dependent flavin oxidoreductase YrpB (nitropropane dioxygenase family)
VIGAGAVFDGRSLAANLAWGAHAVWVGTRFVASLEAAAPPKHKEMIVTAGFDDTTRTLIYSGRPLRVRKTPYVANWWILSILQPFNKKTYFCFSGRKTDNWR